jgi:Tfp pilus assembly protein PilO
VELEELKEQWEELETWKKFLITIFFSGIIVYIVYTFLLEEKISQVENLEGEVSKLRSDITYLKKYAKPEKLKKLNEKIISIQEKISQKEKELEKYKKYIPEKPFADKILIRVSQIANKAGIDLESFSIKEKKVVYAVYRKDLNRVIFKNSISNNETGIRLNKLSFEMKSAGTMKSLYSFLKKLTNTKRILILDKVDISKGKENLIFNIKFSSYYMED